MTDSNLDKTLMWCNGETNFGAPSVTSVPVSSALPSHQYVLPSDVKIPVARALIQGKIKIMNIKYIVWTGISVVFYIMPVDSNVV